MKNGTRAVVLLLLTCLTCLTAVVVADAATAPPRYTNALRPHTSSGAPVDSCPDPSVLRGRGRYAGYWYMYCTSNPLNDQETSGAGAPRGHRLPMLRSTDLVHWRFVGSALPGKPSWAGPKAKLWAPDVVYSSTYRRYYLTYAVTDTTTAVSGEAGCDHDSAIGVATSTGPTGPWRMTARPFVPPRRLGSGCDFADTIDPDVLGTVVGRSSVAYWGSFRGGVSAQPVSLSRYGMRLTGSRTQVTVPSRFEAPTVVARGGYYYLFVSANGCCNGAISGYGVFAGRSRSATGPFVDREGNALTAARAGGTPVLTANGNRWVGPGHNIVFPDRGGQWWTMYHAIDRGDPFFATEPGYTRRPVLLDPLDWPGGWPSVRSGRGPSATSMPGPAARAHQHSTYRPVPVPADVTGAPDTAASDAFDGAGGSPLDPRWSWVREPDAAAYGVEGGALRLDTSAGGLAGDRNTAPVLTEAAPDGDYVVQTAVRLDVPVTGSYGPVQAGLVVRASDDDFVKLTSSAIGPTRVTELGREVPAGPPGYPRGGSMTVGPPGDTTWLRLVRRGGATESRLTAYTSQDGAHWVRGGTWTMRDSGVETRIGLVAMGGAGFTARFDDVRVWALAR